MTAGALAALVVSVLSLLIAGVTFLAIGWPELKPGRHRRPGPFQHPTLPPMDESDVDGEHDWDGFLVYLTGGEPTPTLREEAIEFPREGETQ